jgi:hypothetical protein
MHEKMREKQTTDTYIELTRQGHIYYLDNNNNRIIAITKTITLRYSVQYVF